jgi:hypothetical protein
MAVLSCDWTFVLSHTSALARISCHQYADARDALFFSLPKCEDRGKSYGRSIRRIPRMLETGTPFETVLNLGLSFMDS